MRKRASRVDRGANRLDALPRPLFVKTSQANSIPRGPGGATGADSNRDMRTPAVADTDAL